jgi:release factor glutamine methyltransferase
MNPLSSDFYRDCRALLCRYYQSERLADFVFNQLILSIFKKPACLVTQKDDGDESLRIFKECIFDITKRDKPYQYIVKTTSFYNTTLAVCPPVFIPRVETEALLVFITKKLAPIKDAHLTIADFFAGTGCMGISLLIEFRKGQCDAFDINHNAVQLSASNARSNAVHTRYKIFHVSSLHLKKVKKYNIILANPPYISLQDYVKLDPSVRHWEHKDALTDGRDGISIVRKTVYEAVCRSSQDSLIVVELCSSYALPLYEEVKKKYSNYYVFLWKDQCLKERAILIAKGKYVLFFKKCV